MIIWECGQCKRLYTDEELMVADLLPICECGEDLFDSTTYHSNADEAEARMENAMLHGLDS